MTAINATGGGTLHNVEVNDEEASQTCLYCANLKVLRDLLPPKRCDYCRKWRCQFCTLKFPLLGARKGLPKKLKGNSRICMQCFGQIWQDNEAANSPDMPRRLGGAAKHVPVADTLGCRRELRGVSFVERDSMIESGRRGSMIDSSRRSSTMGSSRRGSMHETERRESMLVDQVWARSGSFSDTHRYSFMDSSSDNDLAKRPLTSRVRHGGVSYRMASLLGLVAGDGADRTSMNSAIGLWMSLFAASILLVIALADGFSLHQRLCYCVATYGFFLTLHPWIYAGRMDISTSDKPNLHKRSVQSNAVAPKTPTQVRPRRRTLSVVPGSGSVQAEYKLRLHELKETLAYYLSDECPWKMIKTTKGGDIYEMTANKTPFAIFKIEVLITGISMDRFLDFVDSKDPKDRCLWDLNEANFEVIETFDASDLNEDADVSVCVNTQKPFLGGLVASRDFCLLNVATENSICFSSVEHPDVPERPGITRGHIFFSCFHCEDDARVEGPEGFMLTYICQTDIGGNLPVKLLYNGTMDNMQKMTKVFLQADNLFSR
ncbi:StAR-related lipid-transfer domain-containing protein [Phytophthora infestans]|uniref:START (StAR-related lipid-transfer) domain-containing protein n=1 Tax=Phytophthora infestans TaxID=4787 RepID=A0A833WE12_PHYIN|nr:StAR-related lipid-transfer domain-containing protein [Phytophthora infestans]KAF4138614.1 START (StAR-related lipid-transfer) domain-containing protein [Phytophthora infestans]